MSGKNLNHISLVEEIKLFENYPSRFFCLISFYQFFFFTSCVVLSLLLMHGVRNVLFVYFFSSWLYFMKIEYKAV